MVVMLGLVIDPLFKVKADMTYSGISGFLKNVLRIIWRRFVTGLIGVLGFAIGLGGGVIVFTWFLSHGASALSPTTMFIFKVVGSITIGSMTAENILIFAKKRFPALLEAI